MKMLVFPLIAFAMYFGCIAAKPVTSDFVQVLGPGEVFAPIPEAMGNTDAARLVDTPEIFTASYAKDFEVDGNLDKPVWKNVLSYTNFLPIANKKFPYKTELKLRYSSKALYMGMVLHQPMDAIKAQYDQDDQPIFNDDNVELLFFVPRNMGESLLHLSINALGSCYDAANDRKVWNLKRKIIKARRFKDRWTLEMKFPYSGLGIEQPISGDYIGMRVCRFVSNPWSRTSVPQLHAVGNTKRGRFGKLLFGETTDDVAVEARAYREKSVKKRVEARLIAAKKLVVSHESASAHFGDKTHPVYDTAIRAIHQFKRGLENFEQGKLTTNEFFALEAG